MGIKEIKPEAPSQIEKMFGKAKSAVINEDAMQAAFGVAPTIIPIQEKDLLHKNEKNS